MPPNLGEDIDLQLEKLTLLIHAGEPFERVAEQWWQLISNHPANMAVNLRWFDMLMDQRRFEDAGSVLEIYAQHNADAPQMLCRRVALALAENKKVAAQEWADRLWQYKGSDGANSIGYAFDEFRRARADVAAAKRVLELHTQGWKVNRAALMFALDAVTDRAQLRKLAEDCISTDDGALAGAALNRLNELNEQKIVVGFGGKHRDFAFAHTPVWQAVGTAYAGIEKFREGYTWLADWRKRPDAEMWAVSSCVACRLDARDYAAALADGVYALENLEHDGSAPYIARNMLLAAFLGGDTEGFKLQYSRFSFLFDRVDRSDATPYALSFCDALLESHTLKEIRALDLQFKHLITTQSVIWANLLDRAWRHEAGRRLTGWGRFWFNLRRFTG